MRGVPRERRAISAPPFASNFRSRILRGAPDDAVHRRLVVEIEAVDRAEAVAQGGGQEREAGRRADEREGRQVEAHRPRGRPLAERHIDRVILHRRVEHFLDRAREAVNFVDEEDIALLEVRQDRDDVAGPLDGGAGGGADGDAEFGGDDRGERRLAEAGRAIEEDMIERLAARPRRLDGDREVRLHLLLPDVLRQPLGPQGRIEIEVFLDLVAVENPLFFHAGRSFIVLSAEC